MKATTPISLTETLPVNSASTKLIEVGKKVVDASIAKKDVIVKAGKGAEVLSAMTAQKEASKAFGVELKAKVPAPVSFLVGQSTTKILDSLEVSRDLKRYRPRFKIPGDTRQPGVL